MRFPLGSNRITERLNASNAKLEALLQRIARPAPWKRPKPVAKALRPRCGARCRDGHACNAPVVWLEREQRARNGRCRMHGGLSCGPRSLEGRARVAEAARRTMLARWAAKRAA